MLAKNIKPTKNDELAPSTPVAPPELLNRIEVATLLRLSPRTIDTLVASDAIPSFKVGGSRRFRRDEVLAWMDAGCPNADGRRTRARKERRS
jgi:excisionase family DNA binding protein